MVNGVVALFAAVVLGAFLVGSALAVGLLFVGIWHYPEV